MDINMFLAVIVLKFNNFIIYSSINIRCSEYYTILLQNIRKLVGPSLVNSSKIEQKTLSQFIS
jgi:uncharacterized ubiquitin-like protein YukD